MIWGEGFGVGFGIGCKAAKAVPTLHEERSVGEGLYLDQPTYQRDYHQCTQRH